VMKEKESLSKSPQRGGSKVTPLRLPLTDAVGETASHVVDREVRVQVHVLFVECRDGGSAGAKHRSVAHRASHSSKQLLTGVDGSCSAGLIHRSDRRRQKPHEGGKFLDIAQYINTGIIGICRIIGRGCLLAFRLLLPFRLE